MKKVLIVYYSSTGNTEKMAKLIEGGVRQEGLKVQTKKVEAVTLDDLLAADGIIMGSPTYYGVMAAALKELLDKSVAIHGKLEGKIGAAFSSSGGIGGGNETTITSILDALLIHGMIIQGDPDANHYGVVCIETPDAGVENDCRRLGIRVAQLLKRLN